MKKEKFDKLVSTIIANPIWYSTYKVTKKDGYEIHTFGCPENKGLDEAKALFKEKGYKGEEVYKVASQLHREYKLDNSYHTFLYNSEQDRISISLFTVGYAYASRKERFFPIKRNIPILAWTKHMYSFTKMLNNKRSPRIQLGRVIFPTGTPMADLVTKTLMNIDYDPTLWISYRHYIDTKNDIEALEKYVGSEIPSGLKHHDPQVLLALYKSLKDYKHVETLRHNIYQSHSLFQIRPSKGWGDIDTDLADALIAIWYDLFVLIISNKITDEEYQNLFAMSNSADQENIVITREIINFKLEDGSN